MSERKVKVILLKSVPKGPPKRDNFNIVERDLPILQDGQALLRPLYLSVDPYMRGKMAGNAKFTEPYRVGESLYGEGYAEVVDTKNCETLKKGDFVTGFCMEWSELTPAKETDVTKRDRNMDPEALLSICGFTGLTAYFGLFEIGKLQEGETILVSGGAGAVGSAVGQIAKLKGAKVVGIAGSDEKVKYMTKQLGFDKGINYKTENLERAIRACPSLNVYWDNVGGDTLDTVVLNMPNFGRVVLCGAISEYNLVDPPMGKRLEWPIINARLRLEGFIIADFHSKQEHARSQLYRWFEEGKLKKSVTVKEGFENVPDAFIDLFTGANVGKALVKIADHGVRR